MGLGKTQAIRVADLLATEVFGAYNLSLCIVEKGNVLQAILEQLFGTLGRVDRLAGGLPLDPRRYNRLLTSHVPPTARARRPSLHE